MRVNVQLIKAANDSHLWGDTFDRKLTDIFSVESEVAKVIAEQLRAKLTGEEERVIAAKPTDNPEAYDAYLRGLAYTLKAGANTTVNALGAQKYLREAVRLDPKFALAWALLSRVDSLGYSSLNLQPTVALGEEAWQAAADFQLGIFRSFFTTKRRECVCHIRQHVKEIALFRVNDPLHFRHLLSTESLFG